MPKTMIQGKSPTHHQAGICTLNKDARRPLDVPVTALELNRFCHTTAKVHCGMMYGKMKIELRYFLKAILVLVIR